MNNLFVKMVGTFCSSSYMYLGWVLKNLCSSGTLACKSLNLHIIPFILFASLVGCSSSDSGSNLLPFNSLTPSSPPEFAIEIEGINPEEGIYYSKNSSPAFKFSNVRDGASVSLHEMEECAGESVSSDSIPADGQVSVRLKNPITDDREYTYYAKHANGAEVFDCLEIKYHLDTLAPAEPTIGLAQGTLSPSNNTTPSFVLSGVEDGALVSLHTDDQCAEANIESGTATGDSITLTLQTALSSDGIYNYYAKQVDRVGNISGCSSEGLDYELDTSALTPTIGLAQGTVSPSNNTTPSFVLSDVEDGALVSLHTDDQCMEANKVTSGTASSDSITLTLQTALSIDGTYTYYAKQVDRAGNISGCSSAGVDYELDSTAPGAPTIGLAQGINSLSSNTTPSFVVSDVEDGDLVSLHTDAQCTEANKVTSGTASGDSITLTLQTALSSDGTYTYFAKQVDRAGNISGCSSAGVDYELDTTAPSAPTIGLAQGISSLSSNTTPSFVVSDVENGALVSLHTDVQCTEASKVESGTATGDSITLTLQTALSIDETYTYYAKQVDRAGNISDCSSAGVDYELDSTAPGAPTIGLAQGISSPSSNTTPSFVLSDVEDGALVSLHTDDQCMEANKVTSGTASSDSITLTLQTALSADGTYTYFAKQVDGIGNISSCSSEGFEYELNASVLTPTIGLAQGTVNPSSNTTPSFVVSDLENNALVSLHTDDQCAEASKVESGTATGDSITLTLQTALSSDGTYTYYAKQVDGGSNISPCSNGISYTLDTIALIPTLSLVTSSPSNNSTPTFSLGNLEIGGSVGLYSDNSCSTLAQDLIEITEESMEITLSMPLVNYSTYSYHTRQIDSFDNISDCSSAISYEFITPPFESVWAVGQSEYGDGDQSVTLPLREYDGNGNNFDYDFTVYWGDGSKETVTAFSNDITHEYTNPGDYTIKIIGPKLPAWYFNNEGDKNKIIEVKNLGVVGWKNLAAGFYDCRKLTRFTAGTTDTAQVTDMNRMLLNTRSLTSINLSGFSTEKVTSMDYMFQSIAATSINVSGFNTINVKSMNGVFWSTASLESLDLSDWNVSNVKSMYGMFSNASKLTTLNLSGWDTSSVAHMRSMFAYASSLTSLDLSHFDTSSVIYMHNMFAYASSLTSLDLSHFDTSSVIYMHNMFAYASKLTTLNLSGWDTSNVTNMQSMFSDTSSLVSLNLSGWDVSAVELSSSIFSYTHADLALTCSDDAAAFFGKDCQ